VLLIVVAVFVAIEVKAMLIGQSADPIVSQGMKHYLEQRPEIARVFNLITLQLGNDVMVSVKVQMATAATVPALIASINRVEKEFRQQYPQVRWSFFEPDSSD
jgi:divalent metal cation (Fe/Co/Zn/Cd) transporter